MPLTKFIARDCELSTTGVDEDGDSIDQWKVTSLTLAQIEKVFQARDGQVWSHDNARVSPYSMDCRRNWASNGQCYYSDMSHVEVCTAETTHPRAFAAQCWSTLLAAEEARKLAEQDADQDIRLSLSASNADVADPSISWGTHLNVSVSEELWEDLFVDHRHPGTLGHVASAVAAGIAFFGAGYILPLKDGTIYSLSARAHHLSRVHTQSTTDAFRRGLLNTRRESHGEKQDRLHLIGFDYSLVAAPLLCTYVQCLLAAAEEGYCGMILYDPVRALRTWSWNLDLKTGHLPAEAPLIDGRCLTLPRFVREHTERLLDMCEGGLITPQAAPEALDLLPRIIELTHYADEGAVQKCAMHLDWAAKLLCLLGGGKGFDDAACRLADHDFANTNPRRGAIWRLWEQGLIDPLVQRSHAEGCLKAPPPESRAWGRGQLIRRFVNSINNVDWDRVDLNRSGERWSPRLRVELPHLDSLCRAQFEPVLRRARDVDHLKEMLDEGQCDDTDPLEDITERLAIAK
jgi:proteasome accessory factor A